jgi:hypothetical protein
VFSLLAIVSTGTRFALFEPARRPFIALEVAWLPCLTLIILIAACGPVLILVIAPGAFVTLEMARRAAGAALIVAARRPPVAGGAGILAGAKIAAFRAGLVVSALIILSLVKSAHTRLEGTRARPLIAVRSSFSTAVIR